MQNPFWRPFPLCRVLFDYAKSVFVIPFAVTLLTAKLDKCYDIRVNSRKADNSSMNQNINKKKFLRHRQTRIIFKWFLNIFIVISLSFCLALIPLFTRLQNTFSGVQEDKFNQQLTSGVTQISSGVNGILNISGTLFSDPRFLVLRYRNADYSNIPVSTRNQLQNEFETLLFPFTSISHTALQLEENVVITNSTVFFNDSTHYYPDFFSVNGLTYAQWTELLAENETNFLPLCHVTTNKEQYDALIFSTRWVHSSYLYACMKIDHLKELVLAKDHQEDCYFTIARTDGTILYSDLPDSVGKYQTYSQTVPYGKISVSIHIPHTVLYENMKPFYIFLASYGLIYLAAMIIVTILGSRFSSKPYLDIMELLESSSNITHLAPPSESKQQHPVRDLQSGFEYISSHIQIADKHLGEYQNTLITQQKILRARFLEKALSGQLITNKDIQLFHSYFPNFPESYCVLLIKLWTYESDIPAPYTEPLLLLQSFLEKQLPNAYQQQFSDTELLLMISGDDLQTYRQTLDFVVGNINREEPSYFIRCLASKIYHCPEDLPTAYRQLQDLEVIPFSDSLNHVCSMEDPLEIPNLPVSMPDLMTLYTAITSGNREMALTKLHSYSKTLDNQANIAFKHPVYEIVRTMLFYIRLEHPQLLMDQHIPRYQSNRSLHKQLAETIELFCNRISSASQSEMDSFTAELFQYIDTHYTDCDLCIASLETHFKCSESTIRKAFKGVTDVPISRYIEQKRMTLANKLLAENQKSIAEIAMDCGYALPHSFYRAYKRIYGHAPTMKDDTDAKA